MVKAIFNEEANLQTANRINEVLLYVNRKDKSQSRDRICLQEISPQSYFKDFHIEKSIYYLLIL